MMDEMTNVVEEAAVEATENVAKEVAAEAARSFDGMKGFVIGLCITGGIAIAGGVAIGARKVYKWIKPKLFKKASAEDPATETEDVTEEDVIDLTTEETEDKKG